MPRPVLMSTLVLRGQQLADMQNDPSIDATEWNAIFSEAYGEGYEVVAAAGLRYFEYTVSLATDGVTNYLPEPADHLSDIDELELILNAATGQCRRLRRIQPQQRAALSGMIGQPRYFDHTDGRYSMYPTPPAGLTLTLRYIAQCPDLTQYPGTNQVDCYCVAGQRFVQYVAAAEAAGKSGRPRADDLRAKAADQRVILEAWAADRVMNSQPVWYVEDVDGHDDIPGNWSW